MARKINWLALVAGVLTFVVVAVSFYTPWWQLTIGQDLIKINADPVNTNFGVFGAQFTIPLIWALNVASILTLVAAGAIMLIYSVVPTKPYALQLLGFSWKKPLYAVVAFAVGLAAIVFIVGHFGITIPLTGSATMTLPGSWTMGATVSATVSAAFQLPFYLAIVVAALCIGARIYHRQIAKPTAAPTPPPLQA